MQIVLRPSTGLRWLLPAAMPSVLTALIAGRACVMQGKACSMTLRAEPDASAAAPLHAVRLRRCKSEKCSMGAKIGVATHRVKAGKATAAVIGRPSRAYTLKEHSAARMGPCT